MQELRDAGVELAQYCRPAWWNLRRFNHRTHRKLLIVDGAVGYTFGHGIADQWLGDGEDADHWRDTGVRLEGPVACALQSVFMENWIEETHCVPAGEGCYPCLERHDGGVEAHVVSSASEEVGSSVALLYTVAIASARKEVIIQNPYFAPDDGFCELLAKMVKRGVAVHLMVPGKETDSPFVRLAGSHLYRIVARGRRTRLRVRADAAAPEDRHRRRRLVAHRLDQLRCTLARAQRGSRRRHSRRAGRDTS